MSDSNIPEQLERARVELLDLTARNRLINTSRSSSRSSRLEIVDELSDDVFHRLCVKRRRMTFLPKPDQTDSGDPKPEREPANDNELQQPDEPSLPTGAGDNHLQTELDSQKLQTRLLRTFYDARTYEQEHGANVLYLATGFLKWFESPSSDKPRYAPLILIPVTLERTSANAKFRVTATEEEISTNLSLSEKLRLEFEISLPEIPESISDSDDFRPSDYFNAVRQAIVDQPRWEVLDNDMVLWLYSFAKFLMYQDLKPESWPENQRIHAHPLIESLLGDGFDSGQVIFDEHDDVDRIITPSEMFHVMDADSSQMLVIEESKCGTNLVVQGPPGTGKSQTITNMIATAVQAGKRVLFIAEKMAALDVVKRRLTHVGLGDMCLELHSHKANKREVLSDLLVTLNMASPQQVDVTTQAEELTTYRHRMNEHAMSLHTPIGNTGLTVFDAVGELVRLAAKGVSAASFAFAYAAAWSKGEMRERKHLIQDLATQLTHVSVPSNHPWRGCGIPSVLPADMTQIARDAGDAQMALEKLRDASDHLATQIPCVDDLSLANIARLIELGELACQMPPCDPSSQISDAWDTKHRRQLEKLVFEIGPAASEYRKRLAAKITDDAWSTDWSQTRQQLATRGRSLFRIFYRDYRQSSAKLAEHLTDRPPRSLDDKLSLLDMLMQWQQADGQLRQTDLLTKAMGDKYQQQETDWISLQSILKWRKTCDAAEIPETFLHRCSQPIDAKTIRQGIDNIKPLVQTATAHIQSLCSRLKLDIRSAFDADTERGVCITTWIQRLKQWQDRPLELQKWIAYYRRYQNAIAADLGEMADQIHRGHIEQDAVTDQFETAYHEAILRAAYCEFPQLAEFEGTSHEFALQRFVELDLGRINNARHQVSATHHSRLPTTVKSPGMKVLRHEMKKKMRHKPLRKMLELAGAEIQAIKPVFMMSPMSVAQYLPPGSVEFDLLLIDEASQVRPCDAIGAIARAKQIVVVGDDRQLPPTTFFAKTSHEIDDSEDYLESVGDLESVLGLCESQNMPRRMLRWHYRSLHQSLIAVSNREFYADQLYVVPSPIEESDDLGLKFHFLKDGVYDRGGSSTNAIEAQTVASAVMRHAHKQPHLSLGVGAFSVAQRDAILDEIERLRRQSPETESFFADEGPEPFFVKNLENIQGDERDCVFISVGYGRDSSGKLSMSFGPLNVDGGERRLNVLVTRAKQQCHVFTSIRSDDIDLTKTNARGVAALKTFLAYAEKGILNGESQQQKPPASEFEKQVATALTQHGYDVHAQVGMEGFVVDLAIVDPQRPGQYLIGIECDGESYRTATSARDRDRIRQQVLEDRGWIIHRIWSIDWFKNPDEQLQRVIATIRNLRPPS
ncbi:DUF4011 domain-containing protein [Stieleria varia]|uniref:ATP-dependent RecD-like DNA helicase n=1 Tax=Stieleria varia TaxID=2528005 RepID=A0A5C6AGD3_9BACT|nr:DUF4011 domain-containing protein [Stieleria varia]TWT98669.1 ATP-dependent RecD-like DNA helicase [Stieleria varia]